MKVNTETLVILVMQEIKDKKIDIAMPLMYWNEKVIKIAANMYQAGRKGTARKYAQAIQKSVTGNHPSLNNDFAIDNLGGRILYECEQIDKYR